jgi:hypothetical protein
MRPKLRWLSLCVAICVGSAAGCSSLKVRTDFDPEVDFGRYATYAWLEEPVRAEAPTSPADELVDPFARNSLLDKRVRRAVDRELEARGYRPAGQDMPAFRVQYHVILESRTKIRSYPGAYYGGYRGHGYYGAYGGGTYSYDYKEGTLIVDVIDARSDRLAWRGWAIGTSRDGYYDEQAVSEAVSAIMAEFPPGGARESAGDEAHRRERAAQEAERIVDPTAP